MPSCFGSTSSVKQRRIVRGYALHCRRPSCGRCWPSYASGTGPAKTNGCALNPCVGGWLCLLRLYGTRPDRAGGKRTSRRNARSRRSTAVEEGRVICWGRVLRQGCCAAMRQLVESWGKRQEKQRRFWTGLFGGGFEWRFLSLAARSQGSVAAEHKPGARQMAGRASGARGDGRTAGFNGGTGGKGNRSARSVRSAEQVKKEVL